MKANVQACADQKEIARLQGREALRLSIVHRIFLRKGFVDHRTPPSFVDALAADEALTQKTQENAAAAAVAATAAVVTAALAAQDGDAQKERKIKHGLKMVAPRCWNSRYDQHVTNALAWFTGVKMYHKNQTQTTGESLFSVAYNLLTGHLQEWAAEAALDFLHNNEDNLADMPNAEFEQRFISAWGMQVRDSAHLARTQLFAGEVVQGTKTLEIYCREFRLAVAKTRDMQELDKIAVFIKGLKPEMVVLCAVDYDGKPWTSMEKCLDFAHGADTRLSAQTMMHNQKDKPGTTWLSTPMEDKKNGKQPFQ